MSVDYKAIEAEAGKAGLTMENFGGGHLRFIGGVTVVDWWPESKRRTACAFGYRGKNYADVSTVIKMTTVALPPLPPKPVQTIDVHLNPQLPDLEIVDDRPKVFRYPDGTVHFSDEAKEMLNIVEVEP